MTGSQTFLLILILFSYPLTSYCFYTNSTNIIELNLETFNKLILKTNDLWIVKFYVKQCEYCKKFIKEYEKAGKALKDFVKLGALNVAISPELIKKYDINEYPKIKIFNHELNGSFDYSFKTEHSAKYIVLDALKAIRKKIDYELKNKLTNSNDVIELNDDNFEMTVTNSEDVWLIVFYDSELNYENSDLADIVVGFQVEYGNRMKIGAVSSDNLYTRSEMDIHQLPAIVFFPFGKEIKVSPARFVGDLNGEDVEAFIEAEYSKMPIIKPMGIVEVNDEETLNWVCKKASLCIVVFLPDLRTYSHPKREKYYKIFDAKLDGYKYLQWVWVWCEFGKIPNLEIMLNIEEHPEPIVSAMEMQYNSHILLKGPFTEIEFGEFLEHARVGAVTEENVDFVDDIYSDGYTKDEL